MKLSTTARVLAAVLGAGLLAGTGLYACGSRGVNNTSELSAIGTSSDASSSRSESVETSATTKKSARRVFRLGLHRAYALRTTTAMNLGAGHALTIALEADLHISYADATSRGERFHFSLRNAKLTGGSEGGFDAERAKGVEGELAQAFFVTINQAGHVTELQVPPEATSLVASLRKHIATLVQYEVNEEKTWETEENDSTGVYHARYENSSDDKGQNAKLVRTKDRYTQMLTAKGLVIAGTEVKQVVAGRALIALDAESWPLSVHVDERSTTIVGKGMNDIVSSRRDDLELTSSDDEAGALGSFFREGQGYESISLQSLELFVGQRQSADVALVNGRSLNVLLAGLEAKDEQSSMDATIALESYLRLHPESALSLGSRMRHYDAGAKRIYGALAASGTAESQDVLAEVLRDRKAPSDAREDAAISLSLAENPQRESLESLRQMMSDKDDEVASASKLAAGNVARKLSATDADAAGDVVTDLLQRLDAARDAGEHVLLLRALGNAGDTRILPYAERFLADAFGAVRGAACESLTFVKSVDADNLLVRTMLRDEESEVRISAIRVSGYRPFDAYSSVLTVVVAGDKQSSVRMAAVERLGVSVSDPRALATLKAVEANDSDADVKEAAHAIIASLATP